MDFRFAHIEYLLALLIIPVLYIIFRQALRHKKKSLSIFRIPFSEKQSRIAHRLVLLFLSGLFFIIFTLLIGHYTYDQFSLYADLLKGAAAEHNTILTLRESCKYFCLFSIIPALGFTISILLRLKHKKEKP